MTNIFIPAALIPAKNAGPVAVLRNGSKYNN